MDRPIILIVDDEEANLGTFARAFRRELVVHVAISGAAALEILAREPIQVLITDYTMPEMNGIELLRIVAERWPNVHRLISSGHVELPQLIEAHRTGLCVELMPKPWRKTELLPVIQRLTSHRE